MRYIEQLQKNAGRDSARISRLERENAELLEKLEVEINFSRGVCAELKAIKRKIS